MFCYQRRSLLPPNNRTPTPSEATSCAPWLDLELEHIAPHIIVPIGRIALHAVAVRYMGRDPGPIRPLHANVLRAGSRTIIPMIHPPSISNTQAAAF